MILHTITLFSVTVMTHDKTRDTQICHYYRSISPTMGHITFADSWAVQHQRMIACSSSTGCFHIFSQNPPLATHCSNRLWQVSGAFLNSDREKSWVLKSRISRVLDPCTTSPYKPLLQCCVCVCVCEGGGRSSLDCSVGDREREHARSALLGRIRRPWFCEDRRHNAVFCCCFTFSSFSLFVTTVWHVSRADCLTVSRIAFDMLSKKAHPLLCYSHHQHHRLKKSSPPHPFPPPTPSRTVINWNKLDNTAVCADTAEIYSDSLSCLLLFNKTKQQQRQQQKLLFLCASHFPSVIVLKLGSCQVPQEDQAEEDAHWSCRPRTVRNEHTLLEMGCLQILGINLGSHTLH